MNARGRTMRICLAALLLVLGGDLPASAAPGTTERVSIGSDGTQGDADSRSPSISANGRYVAFDSEASNLVGGDTNSMWDIFVHDRTIGQTELVSVASDGTQANGHSRSPSISADGRYVAFESEASSLVPGDTNECQDVFVHDRQTGETTRVSVGSDGAQGNGESEEGVISADGRYVAFVSEASNLVPRDTNNDSDIFVHNRQTEQTIRVSVASDGTQANKWSTSPSISADGHYVAFASTASNLVAGDTNDWYDVFVYDQQARQTTRISVASDGAQGNEWSVSPSISADGRYVAFYSWASNLVGDDTSNFCDTDNDGQSNDNCPDVFVHDRVTGETTRVSVASDGHQGNGYSGSGSLSANGRYVALNSFASNLVPEDSNDSWDVFVHDRMTGQTTRVSVASDGTQGNASSWSPSISADGRHVAFESEASSLVPGDTNGYEDVFVRMASDSVSFPLHLPLVLQGR